MQPSEEIQRVNSQLIYWEGYDPSVKVDLSSHAVLTPDGRVLVDPIPLRDDLNAELAAEMNIVAILLTNANHERAAALYKARFGVPVVAHAEAAQGLSVEVDHPVVDGDDVFGMRMIHLPGFAPGELAAHLPTGGGLILFGDAFINLPPNGPSILPAKYCADPKLARKSAQKLLQFPFEVMTFAHGQPVTAGASKKLGALLS